MNLIKAITRLNVLPVWRRSIRVWENTFTPPSLDRLVALLLHRFGWMGGSEKRYFEGRIHSGMVIIDIGANQGLYTTLFSSLVGPFGRVIAFEPEEDTFRALSENLARNSVTNVELYQVALGSESGTATLSKSLIHGGDHSLRSGHHKGFSRAAKVRLSTLDEIVGERKIDFIKIDVQGWEAQVLCGMERVLRNNPDIQIYFEYWPRGLMQAGTDLKAPLKFLETRGFQVMEFDGKQRLLPITNTGRFIETMKKGQFVNLYASRR